MRNGEQPPIDHGFDDAEETTSTGKLRLLRGSPAPAPVSDLHEAMGQLMAAVARIEIGQRDVPLLRSEVSQLRKDLKLDRSFLVRRAARRSSNRLALLVSTLFVLYDQAAPLLRALWRGFHR